MQTTSREMPSASPQWRKTHIEIPLRVVADQLNVPTYLVLRLASRLGLLATESTPGNYLSRNTDTQGLYFSPQECLALQKAISQLKEGQSWQDLKTVKDTPIPTMQVKVTPLYVKALQGKAWLPQYQRPPLTNEKKASLKTVKVDATPKRNPFKLQKPFQRLNHTQAIWMNPSEGKHPFLQ